MFGLKGAAAKIELKRLEKILPEFMVDYVKICKKHGAQLVPVPEILPGNGIRFSLQLDSYKEPVAPPEEVKPK